MPIPSFGLMVNVAFWTCILILLKDRGFRLPTIKDIILYIVIPLLFAVAGGKLLSAISLCLTNDLSFSQNLTNSGTVFYGGLMGGMLGLWFACIVEHTDFLNATDTCACILPLGHAIGRIGCYLNGCCYGCVWNYPLGIPYHVNGVETRVFPTWFAEALFEVLLFIAMRTFFTKMRRGKPTALYLMAYPVFRFIIEFYRGDTIRGFWGGLSTSQWISLLLVPFGIALLVHIKAGRLCRDDVH